MAKIEGEVGENPTSRIRVKSSHGDVKIEAR